MPWGSDTGARLRGLFCGGSFAGSILMVQFCWRKGVQGACYSVSIKSEGQERARLEWRPLRAA